MGKHYYLLKYYVAYVGFGLVKLELILTYSKGELINKNGVSSNIFGRLV